MNIKVSVKEELLDYINDLKNDGVLTEDNKDEWHQLAFNEDYYIAYHAEAIKWLDGHKLDAFEVIGEIIEYEKTNFGEVSIDASSPATVVNMYVYICGEQLLN